VSWAAQVEQAARNLVDRCGRNSTAYSRLERQMELEERAKMVEEREARARRAWQVRRAPFRYNAARVAREEEEDPYAINRSLRDMKVAEWEAENCYHAKKY
jgi:hypothetical protein